MTINCVISFSASYKAKFVLVLRSHGCWGLLLCITNPVCACTYLRSCWFRTLAYEYVQQLQLLVSGVRTAQAPPGWLDPLNGVCTQLYTTMCILYSINHATQHVTFTLTLTLAPWCSISPSCIGFHQKLVCEVFPSLLCKCHAYKFSIMRFPEEVIIQKDLA